MIHHIISNTTEKVLQLNLQHNLTFTPLRSDDNGIYTCNISITPGDEDEFITNAYMMSSHEIVVKGEPYWISMSVVMNNISLSRAAITRCEDNIHLHHRIRR